MTEEEIKELIMNHIPMFIKRKRTGKLHYPYKSIYAHDEIVSHLAKKLHEKVIILQK